VAPDIPSSLKIGLRLARARATLQGRCLVVGRSAGIAVFHAIAIISHLTFATRQTIFLGPSGHDAKLTICEHSGAPGFDADTFSMRHKSAVFRRITFHWR